MLTDIRQQLRAAYLADEADIITLLMQATPISAAAKTAIQNRAIRLIEQVRNHSEPSVMEAFLAEYGLSTEEGVALMCLAEALLRVPDAETIDELIQDKIVPHDWAAHVGDSGSILVNASTWALLLSGRVLDDEHKGVVGLLQGLLRRMGEPLIRVAVSHAMQEMGEQFVLGQTIQEAIHTGHTMRQRGYTYSYDMLGEAARTAADAERYLAAYRGAIKEIARHAHVDDIRQNPGISVKLSALHPRYEFTQKNQMLSPMCERLLSLAQEAKAAQVGLNIDAEEADRLDISLDIIEPVLSDTSLAGWQGFGVVVQAYGQRASFMLDWLYALAKQLDRNIMVRLVKGAYWDSEIKRAQILGLSGYPVFTRKQSTDVSYIACASKLMDMRDRIYPQFATHNAQTIASILHLAGTHRDDFELQRLHGMGEALHDIVLKNEGTRCRIYAPVGAHQDLLAYLVRRLLENGANSSFVNQIVDDSVSPAEIARDPFSTLSGFSLIANPRIVKPAQLYEPARRNSQGWDINDPVMVAELHNIRQPYLSPYQWQAGDSQATGRTVINPADNTDIVGMVYDVKLAHIDESVGKARAAQYDWCQVTVAKRAAILNRIADLYEDNVGEFFALLAREAGKTLNDAIAELREAVDFLRYYAAQAGAVEPNTRARGVIVCISPWNFPLAIFSGQIAAALVTGNSVIAKPAEQTSLIAARAVVLIHQAGVPEDVVQLLPGPGETVGAALTASSAIAGVCFTGSTQVARLIEQQLAQTAPADAMLIAETGGLNAMIVDSTALLEQAVRDIVDSAFRSAGQRCSALRILYVQRELEKKLLTMLSGAMDVLQLGNPLHLQTDVGPIIDAESRDAIAAYCEQKKPFKSLHIPQQGFYIAPTIIKVAGIEAMEKEIFGPVLHIATFEADKITTVIDAINAAGYGLTFGLHTRIDRRAQEIVSKTQVGNFYVNRNQIGAIVGSQPFGGEGLSGTGPKAGGPHYVRRFRKAVQNEAASLAAPVTATVNATVSATDMQTAISRLDHSHWAARHDRIAVLRQRLRGRAGEAMAAAAALDCGPVDLPGPTGEANQLILHPLGLVLCLSDNDENLLAQTVQALSAGNAVLAVGNNADRSVMCLTGHHIPLLALPGHMDIKLLSTLPFAAIATDNSQDLTALRRVLAQCQGPIVRLITEIIYPAAYTLERAICIDTTAAGGNASLLASNA